MEVSLHSHLPWCIRELKKVIIESSTQRIKDDDDQYMMDSSILYVHKARNTHNIHILATTSSVPMISTTPKILQCYASFSHTLIILCLFLQ